MSKKTFSAIRETVRQLLRDEFSEEETEFADDELDIHINECLVEISQRRPYEVKETVESDGTKEVDISEIENLLEVEKVEYPTGSDPPSFQKFSVFGDTLRIEDTTPTSGEDIYLYCHKVHQVTESASTLKPDLEKVLVEGVVAKAAMAFLNKMRDQIVPASFRLYQGWATQQFVIYQNSLNSITRPKVWDFN
jgi:hypothetical protein